jgi:hypothetical protein
MTSPALTTGATLTCSQGLAPAVLLASPAPVRPRIAGLPVVLVTDHLVANVPTFGMCRCPANPAVAAATSAALGVLTPAPCVPQLLPPGWSPPSPAVTVAALGVATKDSTVMCAWTGKVSVVAPSQPFVKA